ncbi:Gfo/Idh/MocA family oxidoreductase [Frankia sp. Cpl3]|nr:Gfo/Idh/MocA family oxidoreductase [Parafrankia colletiae]MCK9902981.1 Gfo/Idh/MocA family oxidoreductase [Frankia sp. Cpl3]
MSQDSKLTLGVGMVGYTFMGATHSHAWRNVSHVFDLPVTPEMTVVCGRDAEKVNAAARRLGWLSAETDWRRLVERDDVALVDVCTPGDNHAEIAIAALEAGKHVLCEKPLANTVEEAVAMTRAAERAARHGVRSMVGFNYRRVPALALAREIVTAGRLGTIRHVRAQYLQDWIVDPGFPLVWRLRRDRAGSGALGDIGAHIIDLAQFVTGELLTGVSALTETFVKERPMPSVAADGSVAPDAGQLGTVTVDDCALFISRLSGGGVAAFEATRFASGRKNAIRLEINGSAGSLAFDFETMNELSFYDHTEAPSTAGFRRILVTESSHPYLNAWWPPGHGLGYDHTFIHEIRDFLVAVGRGDNPLPSFAEGLRVQQVLAAVERSAARNGCWEEIDTAVSAAVDGDTASLLT